MPLQSLKAGVLRQANRFAPKGMKFLRGIRDSAREFLVKDPDKANCRKVLDSEPWTIDRLSTTEAGLEAQGWAFPPRGWLWNRKARFALNGKPFDEVVVGASRPDVKAKFWQRANAEFSGFSLKTGIGQRGLFPGGFLQIAYLNSPARLPAKLKHSWFYADPALELPLPTPEQRFRVIGNADQFGFVLSGATDFNRLAQAVKTIAKRDFRDFRSVLDWGSGCGRVARYSARQRGGELVGCDVDAENVAWCNENLPGKYFHTGMQPPLPFANGKFDLIYGVSVFTHFREQLQDAWLEELHRVIEPGGIVMVTTHGRTAVEYAGLQLEEHAAMLQAISSNGIFVASKNDQLDGAVDASEEYVNVFHSIEYLRGHWSKHFAILVIVPGFVFTHDLVILQRR